MHETIWKFERKNFREYHHMVWYKATNHPVEKGLLCLFSLQTVQVRTAGKAKSLLKSAPS